MIRNFNEMVPLLEPEAHDTRFLDRIEAKYGPIVAFPLVNMELTVGVGPFNLDEAGMAVAGETIRGLVRDCTGPLRFPTTDLAKEHSTVPEVFKRIAAAAEQLASVEAGVGEGQN